MSTANGIADVYHEKQSRELCALHALNNLFQQPHTFRKKDLDEICCNLSPNSSFFNPHRSVLGFGNYDVNVLMAALQTQDCDVVWFDKRKDVDNLNLANVKGFILNIPSNLSLGFIHIPIMRKHWIAVTKVRDSYYNLDSKLSSPACIGGEPELRVYLKSQISCPDKQLFVVVSQSSGRDSIWLLSTVEDSSVRPSEETTDTAEINT